MADTSRVIPHSRRLLAVLLTMLAALLGAFNGMGRVDQMIYDRAMSLAGRPAAADILIVAIDDEAIATLGRWPWPRAVHAALLDRLHGARAVGLDFVFSETDPHLKEGDRLLEQAIWRHGRVVLPVVLDSLSKPEQATLPLAPLAQAAAGLGFINIRLDGDGVVRRAAWQRVAGGVTWEHFTLALLRAGGDDARAQRFLQRLTPLDNSLIPYTGPPGSFQMVSYLSILRGELPPGLLQDKYVLVGTWATALGDVFPTPVSHDASGMSGVEIMGNLLQSTAAPQILRSAQAWQTALASALPVLLLCLALPRLSPRQAFACSAALLAAILAAALAALYWGRIWIPPTAALVGVAACYPLWSWRSQEAALRYMAGEMKRLRVEYPPILDETGPQARRIGPSLDHHVDELDRALSRVRNLRRFLADGLDGMPDATLVIDQAGRLQFRNRQAVLYFLNQSIRPPRIGQALVPALEQAFDDPAAQQQVRHALRVHDSAPAQQDTRALQVHIEVRDRAGQDILLRCAPVRTAHGAHAGLVVTLSDVTAMRQAERQREETLRFIYHDMRAPQNSILSLVALSQAEPPGSPAADTMQRIAHLANRTLHLVDDFIQFTRAESMDIAHAKLDVADVLREAIDDFWAAAQERGISIDLQAPDTAALTYGDRTLILRAVCNLLDNAVKYSPDNGHVHLRVRASDDTWDIDIEDQGPGIAPQDLPRLFEPFFRTGEARGSSTTGTGLGLAFVRAAAQRHGGRITVDSVHGSGTCFTLSLPRALDDADYEA
ncbi:CHASE2 domain-containing protein [Bordetella petrii]|uniref:CHASE2 domain-containing protein n=1 Tax=Bordetella petrii TaxID=94624 RepID=UPI001E5F1EC7|nr:CHASE2 domain-containing protein [Bordetella petrii]MCD0504691.1 CHASE2 domain-containing protein [Bordetella petrii]